MKHMYFLLRRKVTSSLLAISHFLVFFSIILSSGLLNGQPGPDPPIECATFLPAGDSLDSLYARHQRFLEEYDGGPVINRAGLQIVPVQFHIVTMDDGMGGIPEADLLDELNNAVNPIYAAAGLVFVACAPANVINSSAFYDLADYDEGNTMASTYNVPQVVNIYAVNDPDGFCGWAYYPTQSNDYVVLANNCANNGSTMTHELGHYFDLMHTHDTDFGAELVDGSNCSTAGDLFCDTPADPNLSGLVTAAPGCMYTGVATDANGDMYMPDVTNFMSYSEKDCRTSFSPLQLGKIAYTAENGRAYVRVINCPIGTIEYVDANCELVVPDYRDLITLNAPCTLVDTIQVPAPGSILSTGIHMITITVMDANADFSSCEFFITVVDSIPPQFTPVMPDTIQTNLDCEGLIPDYRDSTTVTDNCDPNPIVTQEPPPGTNIGGVGTMQTVLVIAEDGAGNADTLEVQVVIEDAVTDAQLNCVSLNLSVGPTNMVAFRLDELVPGANCSENHIVQIENAFGGPVYYAENLLRNSVISFGACTYLGQELKATVTNEAGESCWGYLTLKQSDGPLFVPGRVADVWCTDSLVAYGHIDNQIPLAYIPCVGTLQSSFVADWVVPYDCEPDQDTAKIIYREYEAFDKQGRRGTVSDTIVVFRLPQLTNESLFCLENSTIYCSDTTNWNGPIAFFAKGGILPSLSLDLIDLGFDENGDLKFSPVELDPKCGLQVHVDSWKFEGNSCEQQYKVAIELKQSCPGGMNNIAVSPPATNIPGGPPIPPNVWVPLNPEYTYWKCEFWVTDRDTVPPIFSAKIFDEFPCITVDTGLLSGDLGFLDIFQPVVYTNEHECYAETYLPPLCVFDDWSGIKSVKAIVEGGSTYVLENEGEECYLFELGDQIIPLEDFTQLFGGDLILTDSILDIIDSLGILDAGQCYRSHVKVKLPHSEDPVRIFYEVYDSCHLMRRDTVYMHVKDLTKPVAVADKGLTVSLSDKKQWVDAIEFDEGSWDNCGVNLILARRSDWQEACVDLCYNYTDDCMEKESALCWLWTDGHDTLWMPELEDDKNCDEVEAHYKKQLDWFCSDDLACGPILYNSWLYDLIKYGTTQCKPHSYLDDQSFHKLFKRAVGNPQQGDQIRIKNQDILTLFDTALGGILADSFLIDGDILLLDSTSTLDIFYGVDVFKCQAISSAICTDLNIDSTEDLFLAVYIQLLLQDCFSFFPDDIDVFIPNIFPDQYQNQLFDSWSEIGGGWSDAVPFSCEDACGPVTVEILVMDYWCNWSTAWTTVWVEDKTPIKVAKDVVEEIEITCATYKADQYYYPEQIHAMGLDDLVALGKEGDSLALSVLDTILGGYCKAWEDPYGNYVDIDGNEIDCDIHFSDAYCHCEPIDTQIRVYDDHFGYIWKDSTYTKCYYETEDVLLQKGVVVVNCAENVYCEQELWCEFDHCGQGYIFRKWKIWSSCEYSSEDGASHIPDTTYRHQRIWVGNECELSKYMFDVPGDTTITSCALEYDPAGSGQLVGDLSPDFTGYPVYKFDDDCRIIGIGHSDKVFKVVGGDAACYKVVRTWYFADWCGGKPVDNYWWYDRGLIIDSCVQKIIVQDTVGPVCTITGPVNSGDTIEVGGCDYNFAASVSTTDACGVISYSWVLKQIEEGIATEIDSDLGALSSDTTAAFDISSDGLLPGTYKLVVTTVDECQNEGICEYDFTLLSAKKPTPICISLLSATLTPWDTDGDGVIDSAHAVIWASEFNSSSALACEDDSLAYRIEFLDGIDDDTYLEDSASLDLTCANVGSKVVRLWVLSYPSGTADYCDVILMVQSDGEGCDVSSSHTPSGKDMAEAGEHGDTPDRIGVGANTPDIPGDALQLGATALTTGEYILEQNRPNPFREETVIEFSLPEAMEATITIYDMTGRQLRQIQGDFTRGYNQVQFRKEGLQASGILFYQLRTAEYTEVKRMMLVE